MIGVDEVGRGAWAGDFVAVAVRLRSNYEDIYLADSKTLTFLKRLSLAEVLKKLDIDVSYAYINPKTIDKYGLTWTQRQAMTKVIKDLKPAVDELIIIDGKVNYVKDVFASSKAIIKADKIYRQVMAASVLAKVARDEKMIKLSQLYPNYEFDKHKGYGTKLHYQALLKYKPIKGIHRFSYKPIKALLPN